MIYPIKFHIFSRITAAQKGRVSPQNTFLTHVNRAISHTRGLEFKFDGISQFTFR